MNSILSSLILFLFLVLIVSTFVTKDQDIIIFFRIMIIVIISLIICSDIDKNLEKNNYNLKIGKEIIYNKQLDTISNIYYKVGDTLLIAKEIELR
jgi:c-di-AMP phosphodiesterase-like protein